MTTKAKNCIALFFGANPETVKAALTRLAPSVLQELKEHFGTSDLTQLAIKLALGKK